MVLARKRTINPFEELVGELYLKVERKGVNYE
jgi:hypothetical protein